MEESLNNIYSSKTDRVLNPHKNLYRTIAYITFTIQFFFIFYGTSLPFSSKITDADDIATSNIINQLVFSFTFLIALFLLIPKWEEVKRIIITEKFLFIFLAWSFLTIGWSDHMLVSFKRYLQYLGTVLVSISILVHTRDSEETIKVFKYLLAIYVIISLVSILSIPGAKNRYGVWRGLAPSKNHLGQMSVIALIFWSYLLKNARLNWKFIYGVLLIITTVLFIGSSSFTSVLVIFILIGLSLLFKFDEIFKPIGLGRTVSLFSLLIFVSGFFLIIFATPEILESIFGTAGKDMTLTGRTDLWADIWESAKNYFLWGCGFQGFWVVDSPQLQALYDQYIWLPIQAHNGYLDIINETGLVGFLLFLFMIINFFRYVGKLNTSTIWKWFVIGVLIINLTESTLIRPRITSGVMYIFAYLAVFSDYLKQTAQEKQQVGKIELNNELKELENPVHLKN